MAKIVITPFEIEETRSGTSWTGIEEEVNVKYKGSWQRNKSIALPHINHKQKSSLLFHNMQWTNAVVHYSVTDFEKHSF